jgi:Family of unknown function (DUF6176)
MDVECVRIKLKPDTLATVQEWAARMNHEMKAVKELLRKEGMAIESVFLEEASDGNYLIYYLRSNNLKKARNVSRASQHPLDIYHQDVMRKVAIDSTRLKCLLDASSE